MTTKGPISASSFTDLSTSSIGKSASILVTAMSCIFFLINFDRWDPGFYSVMMMPQYRTDKPSMKLPRMHRGTVQWWIWSALISILLSNGPTDFTPLCHLRRHSPLLQVFSPYRPSTHSESYLKALQIILVSCDIFHFSFPLFRSSVLVSTRSRVHQVWAIRATLQNDPQTRIY